MLPQNYQCISFEICLQIRFLKYSLTRGILLYLQLLEDFYFTIFFIHKTLRIVICQRIIIYKCFAVQPPIDGDESSVLNSLQASNFQDNNGRVVLLYTKDNLEFLRKVLCPANNTTQRNFWFSKENVGKHFFILGARVLVAR